ncbi:MAG: MATE family efflux transporter [Lachnospiraceae bacterium]|nr:MATE family efflux transporter [Lachnospiraceae bacterium]
MSSEWFEKAPVHKAYFKFSLPVVCGLMISLVYNMVDTWFIARTGNTDLVAGVALSAPVFILMVALGDMFGLGGASVISRLFGQQKDDEGRKISIFCFYAAIIIGVIVSALMLLFRQPILHLLGADQDTMAYASGYYTYIVMGAPLIILSFTPNNQLRTEGFATQSMIGGAIGSVVNIILDPVFIFGFGWGAAGAAIATVLGYVCTDSYYIWLLLRRTQKLSVDIREFRVVPSELQQILAIGVPACITNLMQSFGMTMLNRFLLPYGNDRVAAMGIVTKTNLIANFVIIGFAFGAQPLIGYNYGAGNRDRLKKILRFCYGFECCIAVVISGIMSLAAPYLLRMFIADEHIVALGTPMLRIQQIGMMFMSIVLVTTVIFQAAGKAWGAFLLSVSRQGVIFAVVICTVSRLFGYTGVLMSQPAADVLTALLAVVLFMRSVYRELAE